MDDQDAPAPPIALVPQKPRTLKKEIAKANQLVKQAAALQEGERKCKGRVKLRADMTRRVGPDNPYLRNPDGSVQSRPCRKVPIIGGSVCPNHGGKAPQVRKKADKRLLAMVEPSLVRLEALINQDEHMPTALGAIRTVLERAGSKAPIGPLAKEAGDKDTRPVINILIKPGGLDKPVVAIGVQQPVTDLEDVEGEVIERDDESDA